MSDNFGHNDRTETHIVLSQGTMVAHYRIIEKIGAGGMGEVYLAQDTELDRKVALKFLPQQYLSNSDAKTRFKREAQAAAGLKHPNIVTIHEVGEFNGRPYFVMEHCEGQSLRDLMKDKSLSIDKIVDYTVQLCDGLQEAHSAGVIHRDIKPSNIVIDRNGRPKLVDFGLASIRGAEKLTKTGSTLGTVGYMSPEQIEVKDVDQRSDLFSLGVVLYEMIAGRVPFAGETEAATLKAVIGITPEPLARYKSDIPDKLQEIVSKLLEKDPGLRYQSAAGVVSDLKRLTVGAVSGTEQSQKDWWNRFVVPGAVLVLIVMAAYWLWPSPQGIDGDGVKSIAVLPFENLGAAEDEYFADGITDEITSRLAGLSGLRVTSRTSAVHYKNAQKPLMEIGKELGVDFILEGTIRWDKSGDTNRVRITPQLIRVADDSHVWADNIERALTQVFAVQAEIATRIADALDVTLLDAEEQLLEARPTDNLVAYDFYLRGKEYWEGSRNAERAVHMFEKAVELDSTFYQAYAMLARLYGYAYINGVRRNECLTRGRGAAEKALRWAQGKPEGYLAMGYYHYYFSRDYDRALELFGQALENQPNNSDLLEAIAYVHRRQGRWEEAVAGLRLALRLDPLSLSKIEGLARTLFYMHRFDDARLVVDNAVEFAPDHDGILLWKMMIAFFSGQDSADVRAAFDEFGRYAPPPKFAYWAEIAKTYTREYQTALQYRSSPGGGGYELSDSVQFYLSRGTIYRSLGKRSESRAYFDSARVISERRVENQPDDGLAHIALAQAYAGVGRNRDAIRLGQRAVDLLPIEKDAIQGADVLGKLGEVYVMTGENGKAIELLDSLLSIPSLVHVYGVRTHPIYDPLRDDPRFQALLEKYEK